MEYLLALVLLLAPTYAIRFSLHGLPTNILMLAIVVVWIVFKLWLIKTKKVKEFYKTIRAMDKKILWLTGLFFLAGIISLFVGGLSREKLGQFIVLFLEPTSMFFIGYYIFKTKPESKQIFIKTIYILLGLAGVYALLQYFTLIGLPAAWWGNSTEPKRAIAFFEFPNAYALFVTPLLAFLLPDLFARFFKKQVFWVAAWVIGGLGLLLSLSRGGWLGLFVALIIFLIIIGNKKFIKPAVITLVVVAAIVAIVPNLRYRVILPFLGEKSSVSRFSLVNTGFAMVKYSPILGKGLLGFSNNWNTYNKDPYLGHLDFPHNIFLNFWIDTGLLGLLVFLDILLYGFKLGFRNKNDALKLGLGLFLIALLVHGLIDVPYIKNDLALVFWLVFSIGLA